jgi:hypothetical protein
MWLRERPIRNSLLPSSFSPVITEGWWLEMAHRLFGKLKV